MVECDASASIKQVASYLPLRTKGTLDFTKEIVSIEKKRVGPRPRDTSNPPDNISYLSNSICSKINFWFNFMNY